VTKQSPRGHKEIASLSAKDRWRIARNDALWFILVFVLTFGCPPAWAEYQPKGKRDPFVPFILPDGRRITPPGEEDGSASGLGGVFLQGILFDPAGNSTAILNGRVLRENEEWEGIKLLKVENNGVTIWRNGETHRMTLQKSEKESKAE